MGVASAAVVVAVAAVAVVASLSVAKSTDGGRRVGDGSLVVDLGNSLKLKGSYSYEEEREKMEEEEAGQRDNEKRDEDGRGSPSHRHSRHHAKSAKCRVVHGLKKETAAAASLRSSHRSIAKGKEEAGAKVSHDRLNQSSAHQKQQCRRRVWLSLVNAVVTMFLYHPSQNGMSNLKRWRWAKRGREDYSRSLSLSRELTNTGPHMSIFAPSFEQRES